MSADVIPFRRRADLSDDGLDHVRLELAEELANFAITLVAEVIGDRGIGLESETKIGLLLACSIIESETASEGGAA